MPIAPSPEPHDDEPQHCYICKQDYSRSTTSTTSSARLRRVQFPQAHRTRADLRGRVALLTGGRVKIGYQAGIKLLRAGAHLIVTTRFPARLGHALRRRAGLRRVGRSAGDLRPRPAPHAERRGVLPAPAPPARGSTSSSTTPARPCAARPSSTAHDGGETSARCGLPEVRRLLGAYEGLRGYHMLPESAALSPPHRRRRCRRSAGAPA
jgi:hypothetical protein